MKLFELRRLNLPLATIKYFSRFPFDKEYSLLADLIIRHCPGDTVNMIDCGANIGFTTFNIKHAIWSKRRLSSILV